MAEIEIVVMGRNLAKQAFASARADTDVLKAKTDEMALAMRRAGLAAAMAGDSAKRALSAAASASERAAASSKLAADAADKLARGEISAADAAKIEAKAQADAVKATDMSVRASRALERQQILQADAARKAGDSQMVAAGKTKRASEETSLLSRTGGMAAKAMELMKVGTLGFGAAAAYSVDKAMKFQAQMTQLLTQAHVAKGQFADLNTGVLQLAGQVGQSPTSLAESLYHVESSFASLGIKAPKALEMVRIAAQGARIGGADLVETTNALTAAIATGLPGTENMSAAMGSLSALVGAGDMHMKDLNKAFGGGSIANMKGYGASIQDVAAMLATFGDNNIRGAVAGTQMRMAVQSLAHQASSAGPALTKLGMSSDQLNKDLQKGGVKLALNDLVGHMKKVGITAKEQGLIITELFGKKAGAGIGVLVGQIDRVNSKYPVMAAGAKSLGKDSATASATSEAAFKRLQGTVQALAITFGSALLPAITPIADALNKALANPVVQKGISDLGKYLGQMLTAAAPLLPIIFKLGSDLMKTLLPALKPLGEAAVKIANALGKQLGKVLADLAPHLPKLAKAFADMAVALIPLIPSLAKLLEAFIPLVPAVTKIMTVVAKFGTFYVEAWAKIIELTAWVIKKLAQGIEWLVKKVYDFFKWLYDELVGHSIIPDMMKGIHHWFNWMVDKVKAVVHWFEGLSGMFRKWLGDCVSAISSKLADAVGWFRGLSGRIVHALGDVGQWLYKSGAKIVQGLIDGIGSMIGSVGNSMSGIASKIMGFLPHSPAKEGPLSGDGDPAVSGKTIVARLADGISASSWIAGAAIGKVAKEVHAGLPGPVRLHANPENAIGRAFQGRGGLVHVSETLAALGSSVAGAAGTALSTTASGARTTHHRTTHHRTTHHHRRSRHYYGTSKIIVEFDFKSGGTPLEQALILMLRHGIRVRGGNVQAVLGKH
jgi:TP901 family phage tail tape measure protein